MPPYNMPPPFGPPYGGYPQQGYGGYAGGPMPPQMPPAPGPYGPGGYGYAPGMPGRLPGRPATMGARLGGLIVDSLVLGVPFVVVGFVTGAFRVTSTKTCDASGYCTTHFQSGSGWLLDLFGLALGLAYSAYFVGTRTQTIGHRAAGIRVVDINTGGRIGPGRGALRWLVLSLTGALCTLGYWSPFFDGPRRQGWHDKASRSIAISVR